jgi:cytochrome c553
MNALLPMYLLRPENLPRPKERCGQCGREAMVNMVPWYQTRHWIWSISGALFVLCLGAATRAQTAADAATAQAADAVPAWLFSGNSPKATTASGVERSAVKLPGSELTFHPAQLIDLFFAPDWFPRAHAPMPEVVAHGRRPDVYACGYCHLPSGQGRPENSSLAGLPAAYIEQQVADFKSGDRRSPWQRPYRPSDLMIHLAAFITQEEVSSAAEYFSKLRLRPRVRMVESSRVPRARVEGLVYVAIRGGGDEELGERLLEFAPDPLRHERRDETMRYIAYAPIGSIGRGHSLANFGIRLDGGERPNLACVSCHGAALRGVSAIPGLAARSPSYLLRQLLAFKVGARVGQTGAPMQAVAASLQLGDMIDAAAYAASLPP